MKDSVSSVTARGGWTLVQWWIRALLVCVLSLFVGCAGPEERGDRALAAGNMDRAMVYYDQAIADGSRDPALYFRAAQAAQSQGAFAKAERYFSQSLRYGGGTKVARALAQFYINTSNFAQAARVFQYLARTEEEIQPLYTNIGTALMYAGKYLDAESYLMLAHQMAPEEPVPYINLGVLYDRHLRNRPRAVRFYECFAEMSDDAQQVRLVRTRLREIENERPVDTSHVHLDCGEEYQIHHPTHEHLGQIFEFEDEREEERDDAAEEKWLGEVVGELPLVFEPGDGELEGERNGGEEVADPIIDRPMAEGSVPTDEGAVMDSARRSFEAGRYDEVVERLEESAEQQRSLEAEKLLGRAYYRVGRFEEASRSLEKVLSERPEPKVVEDLLDVYERRDEARKMEAICDRFTGWPDYEEVLAPCH